MASCRFPSLAGSYTLLALSCLYPLTAGYAHPQRTAIIPHRVLSAVPWPPAPTQGPQYDGIDFELRRRQNLNTVCGFIGGDPHLPATCSAGSHCAIDSGAGAIGCCPDDGPCTQGIFTGCVDYNSGPQIEIDPYVFTCGGSDVCYKNQFAGGYFQYGCGSTSALATSVATSVHGYLITLPKVTAQMTAATQTLSEPTTIGTVKPSKSHNVDSTQSTTSSSATSKTNPAVAVVTDVNTDAPSKDNDKLNTGAIVGGTVGAVVAALIILGLVFCLLRRKRGNTREAPGLGKEKQTQYVEPVSDRAAFAPLTSIQEDQETPLPQAVPAIYSNDRGAINHGSDNSFAIEPRPLYSSYSGRKSVSTTAGVSVVDGRLSLESDEVPLTDEHSPWASRSVLQPPVPETYSRPTTPVDSPLGPYPGPRGGGSRPFWHQNRPPSSRDRERSPSWV